MRVTFELSAETAAEIEEAWQRVAEAQAVVGGAPMKRETFLLRALRAGVPIYAAHAIDQAERHVRDVFPIRRRPR